MTSGKPAGKHSPALKRMGYLKSLLGRQNAECLLKGEPKIIYLASVVIDILNSVLFRSSKDHADDVVFL